jgi:hypothetical protein
MDDRTKLNELEVLSCTFIVAPTKFATRDDDLGRVFMISCDWIVLGYGVT